ncbi:uncharacterized protein METZ01_LOCUS386421 [marine metagenome]|uniref:Uncharacterized protein n=1 Tax=marine metagenome TaxID=408172 RepID=A0A382UHM8_9ZZZZ
MPEQTQPLPDYLNSSNLETRIPFELSRDSNVPLTVYNLSVTPARNISVVYLEAGSYVSQSKNIYWGRGILLVKE